MAKDIIYIFFVAIVLFLLLNNGDKTVAVVGALSEAVTNATVALQGR